ncbi:MAG: FAD:protein FMN transferase [Defluviitaleaceae bacterium]|nr:FAD:protein FMN transferase [Defluviitaleaceae bacterium]MCL2239688.1 FAD:protein FMN transferase [Defluviitaleaceae bacterium]
MGRKGLFFLFFVVVLFASCGRSYKRFQAGGIGYFDSFVIFMGYAQSEADFAGYTAVLFDRLRELHELYDIFQPHEGVANLYEINAMAGSAPVAVAGEIVELLLAAKEAHALTGGAVNVALGPVVRIWREYRQKAVANPAHAAVPAMYALAAAAGYTDINDVIIDTENRTVFLRTAGMSLDVGAIAKGFAAGLAMEALAEAGMERALLNLGGHIVAFGQPPGRTGWEAAIAHRPLPEGNVVFTDGALSVSSAYERFFEWGGRRFGHIIDPATLMPAGIHTQVAVLHGCSWMADVLSTALFILPKEEGLRLAGDNDARVFWP